MNYEIITSGERVRLDVLANADKSVVGLKVGNCRIITIDFTEFYSLVISVLGQKEINNLYTTLFKYHCLPPKEEGTETDNSIVVMETVGDTFCCESFVDSLKLYQSADIFSCYFFSYRFTSGSVCGGGIGKIYLREHQINWPFKPYKLTNQTYNNFQEWFETHQDICGSNQNDKFKKIKTLYLDSYLTDDADQSFVMISVGLEMLFGADVELTYRISRGVALFLSHDRDEMQKIFKNVKRLYKVRSKYVHEGKSVGWEELFELREILRKVIVLMYESGMHSEKFDFSAFSEELTFRGY